MISILSGVPTSSGGTSHPGALIGEIGPEVRVEHAVESGVWDNAPFLLIPEVGEPDAPEKSTDTLSRLASRAEHLGPEDLSTRFRT